MPRFDNYVICGFNLDWFLFRHHLGEARYPAKIQYYSVEAVETR
jgi:hypothetical protein